GGDTHPRAHGVAPGAGRNPPPPTLPGRAHRPRRPAHGDRRGHERDPADRHRARSRRGFLIAADSLLAAARRGDTRSVARLLTIVENDEPGSADVLRALYPETGTARIVGITGPPGRGKRTLVP